MMDEDQSREPVGGPLADTNGETGRFQAAYLERELARLQPEDIVGFRLRTDNLLLPSLARKPAPICQAKDRQNHDRTYYRRDKTW